MPKRGSYRKGEAKRVEILQAALDVFATEGYRGTSLRKVAERCGLSLPGIMHYFDSKEALLTEVLRMRDTVQQTNLPDTDHAEAALEIVRAAKETPGLIELFVSMAAAASDTTHPAHEFFAHRYENFRTAVTGQIQKAMDAGQMDSTIPAERVAVLLLSVVDGVQLQWLTDRSIDMEQALSDALHLLRRT